MTNEVQAQPVLPALPGQAASPAKMNQLYQLAQRGTELADMSKITGLPAPLIEAALEAALLPPDLKELIPDANTYSDLNLAIRAAKHKRLLKHEDKAQDIYATLLQKTEEALNNGGHLQLRTLLEGIRVLQPQAAKFAAAARADAQAASVTNNIRSVNISLSGLTQTARPILDENGNILGISDDHGQTIELVNMDVNTLRYKAGTHAATSTAPAQSMRQLLNQAASVIEHRPEEADLTSELMDLAIPKTGLDNVPSGDANQ